MPRVLLFLSALLMFIQANAQTYNFVTHSSGTQTINGNAVTVSPINTGTMYLPAYCGLAANSYYCGQNANALGFKYEFGTPINRVRMRFAGMNAGENIAFFLNGVQYMITATNVSTFLVCTGTSAVAVNGALQQSTGTGGAQVDIQTVGVFDSIRVHHLGGYNLAGTVYDFQFASDSVITITEPYNDTVYCASDSIHVPFTVAGSFAPGNVFTLQLSDATGGFATPITLGTLASNVSGTIHGKIPLSTPFGAGYKVRISSSSPVRSSSPNIKNILIKLLPVPVAATNAPVCEGATLNVSATAPSSSVYSWTGPSSFSSTQAANTILNATTAMSGDYIVTATMSGCTAKDTVTVLVKPLPSAPTAGNGGAVCEGSTLNLTASSTTPGVGYVWNGPLSFSSPQQNPAIPNTVTGNSGIYSVSAVLNGCSSPAATTTATVKPIPPAPTAGNTSPVCAGADLQLTASTPTTGVTYNWTGPNSFSSTLQNPTRTAVTQKDTGDYGVTVTLNGCTSAPAVTNVVVNVLSSIGGWISPNDTICEGTLATFVAVPTNGGPAPQFQWFKNGIALAGETTPLLKTSNIVNGDSFYCQMIAPNVCINTLTVYSNGIKVFVLPISTTPSVDITSTPVAPQPGQPVLFYATVVNGGYKPTFQWQRNGQNIIGAIHANWSANNLHPNDKISCLVESSDLCATPKNANSDTITVNFPTAISNLAAGQGIQLYPNPNKGKFVLQVPDAGLITADVINAAGQLVYRQTRQGKTAYNIALPESLANGVYQLRAISDKETTTLRFTLGK